MMLPYWQEQQDAHTAAELHMRDMAEQMGVDYETIAKVLSSFKKLVLRKDS